MTGILLKTLLLTESNRTPLLAGRISGTSVSG